MPSLPNAVVVIKPDTIVRGIRRIRVREPRSRRDCAQSCRLDSTVTGRRAQYRNPAMALAGKALGARQKLCGKAHGFVRPRAAEEDGKKTAFSICQCMHLRIAPAS